MTFINKFAYHGDKGVGKLKLTSMSSTLQQINMLRIMEASFLTIEEEQIQK